MNASERRLAIWHTLCDRRHITISYIATQYQISWQTARDDVTELSLVYPIVTARGYNGGVKLADWFDPNQQVLTPIQMDLLLRLSKTLSGNDAKVMRSIISKLSTVPNVNPQPLHLDK